jgi:hypothetical protein
MSAIGNVPKCYTVISVSKNSSSSIVQTLTSFYFYRLIKTEIQNYDPNC